jgi:hypothetical protein
MGLTLININLSLQASPPPSLIAPKNLHIFLPSKVFGYFWFV